MNRIYIFILLLLIIPSVFAVGINPSKQEVKVFENHTHTIDFCVYNEFFSEANPKGLTVTFDLEAPGEFIESFSFPKNNFTTEGRYDCTYVTFNSTNFKTIDNSSIDGAIVVLQAARPGGSVNHVVKGLVTFDLSEISYKQHIFRNFGKFSLMALSIFLVGALLINLLIRKKEHE